MPATTPPPADPPTRDALQRRMTEEGLTPTWWTDGPGGTFPTHEHSYDKVLYCQSGGITFHMRDRDIYLRPGDRLDLPAGTPHAATVGPQGVVCVEGAR